MKTRSTFGGKRALLRRKSSRKRRFARFRATALPSRFDATKPARVGCGSGCEPTSKRKLFARTRAPGRSCKRTKSARRVRRSTRVRLASSPTDRTSPPVWLDGGNEPLRAEPAKARVRPEVGTRATSGRRPGRDARGPCGGGRSRSCAHPWLTCAHGSRVCADERSCGAGRCASLFDLVSEKRDGQLPHNTRRVNPIDCDRRGRASSRCPGFGLSWSGWCNFAT